MRLLLCTFGILFVGVSTRASDPLPQKVFAVLRRDKHSFYVQDIRRRRFDLNLSEFQVSQREFIKDWFVNEWVEIVAYVFDRTLVPAKAGWLRVQGSPQASTTVYWNFIQVDLPAVDVPHGTSFPQITVPTGTTVMRQAMLVDSPLIDTGEYDQFIQRASKIKDATLRLVSQYVDQAELRVNLLVISPSAKDKVTQSRAIVAGVPGRMMRKDNGRLVWLKLAPQQWVQIPQVTTQVIDEDHYVVFESPFKNGFLPGPDSRMRILNLCQDIMTPPNRTVSGID